MLSIAMFEEMSDQVGPYERLIPEWKEAVTLFCKISQMLLKKLMFPLKFLFIKQLLLMKTM